MLKSCAARMHDLQRVLHYLRAPVYISKSGMSDLMPDKLAYMASFSGKALLRDDAQL